jgi:antitoxin (DNA-binding transcriptional repressor) of toxin-antitoxin stability system
MRSAQVSELKERLDEVIAAVKNGETVEIREGIAAIAQMVPEMTSAFPPRHNPDQSALEAHIDDLVRQGKAHRGTGTLPDDFFTRPRPKFDDGSVVAQLLRDREEGW